MTNKRQLKKAICRACGEVAGECIFASEAYGTEENREKWDSIIVDTTLLQAEAINRVTAKFDKAPKDFANGKEYKKAHRAFFKEVVKSINEDMTNNLKTIAARMNELMPKKA